jgi:hypothetical protein
MKLGSVCNYLTEEVTRLKVALSSNGGGTKRSREHHANLLTNAANIGAVCFRYVVYFIVVVRCSQLTFSLCRLLDCGLLPTLAISTRGGA